MRKCIFGKTIGLGLLLLQSSSRTCIAYVIRSLRNYVRFVLMEN
jgi:hypothetical protein